MARKARETAARPWAGAAIQRRGLGFRKTRLIIDGGGSWRTRRRWSEGKLRGGLEQKTPAVLRLKRRKPKGGGGRWRAGTKGYSCSRTTIVWSDRRQGHLLSVRGDKEGGRDRWEMLREQREVRPSVGKELWSLRRAWLRLEAGVCGGHSLRGCVTFSKVLSTQGRPRGDAP